MDTADPEEHPRVTVVIDGGIISEVLSSDPRISVNIVEMDSDYTSSDQAEEAYSSIYADQALRECVYSHTFVGYDQSSEI